MVSKLFRQEWRNTLYFRLALIWLAALMGGGLYILFNYTA